MILRRVIHHFRNQEWTAIVLDFVIVVVGVFIGIQVANWNALRSERAQLEQQLLSLRSELQDNQLNLGDYRAGLQQQVDDVSYLLEQASGAPLPGGFASARGRIEIELSPPYDADDPNTIGIAMFILTTLDGNRLTYDTMINAGGIGIIRDDALAREIQTYYAHVDKALSFEDALGQSRVELVDAQQEAGLSPVDATPADQLAAIFNSNANMLAAAKNYWLYTNRHLKDMKALRAEAERLAEKIENGARS